ncbi:MAG: T9SS type A sorting domain-containing protein, partial [Bacteroidales bacterium]|nr:T9SS type A sorting domain-containing protein [Bacteroidales bacterium]
GAGIYSVTIYDSGSCSRILSNEIIEPEALIIGLNHTDITCYGDADGEIELTVSGGTVPYYYEWSNTQETSTISDLEPNNYLYTVTDGNGCTETGTQQIVQPDLLLISESITNNSCYGDLSGIIDITVTGGTTPYEITWDDDTYVNGEFDVVNAPAGFYNVTVSDQHSCTTSESYEITEPDGIDIISEDLLHVHCFGESTGEIDIEAGGGFGTLSYEWVKEGEAGIFSTDQDLTGLFTGTYHLTITDENFCETTTSYMINESPLLNVEITITPITCAGYEDGGLLAVASGGTEIYSAYYWYNDLDEVIGVTPHITGLTAGDYYVVCRDSYYCYDTAYATLTQAVPHVYEISATDMTCNGNENGTITVIIDGGSGVGYTFNWEEGIAGNTNIATNVGAGTWSVTVTDPTDCTELLEETINEPEMLDVGYFDEYAYICYGNSLILNPGTFVSYEWSTGSTNPTIEVENEDLYFVEVVDATGCHLGDTVYVVVSTVFNEEEINLATVTDDETIKIMWEKTPDQGTELYKIYRDAGDGFEFLTDLEYSEPAIYEDLDVNPSEQYYKYLITSVDSCGAESDYSEHHRTCLLNVVPDNNGVCYLDWAGYQGFFVVYYYIMSGSTPDNLTVVDSVLYSTFNYVQMNPNEDGTYYRIKVRRIDGCSPGDGEYYDEAYSNIVYCDNISGIVNTVINNPEVYPNPFNNEININFMLNIAGDVKYSVINMLGQTVYDETIYNAGLGNQTITINPDLDAGIYILKLGFGNELYNFRIVKN